jgi:hypothetical protein
MSIPIRRLVLLLGGQRGAVLRRYTGGCLRRHTEGTHSRSPDDVCRADGEPRSDCDLLPDRTAGLEGATQLPEHGRPITSRRCPPDDQDSQRNLGQQERHHPGYLGRGAESAGRKALDLVQEVADCVVDGHRELLCELLGESARGVPQSGPGGPGDTTLDRMPAGPNSPANPLDTASMAVLATE